MAFSTSNIGKNCYINVSKDQNIEDSLYGTIIGYINDQSNNEEYYLVSINGNVEKIYNDSLVNIINDSGGGGGGGSVTPSDVATAIGNMTSAQASSSLTALGGEPKKLIVSITSSGGVYSADKTFEEIYAAYNAGKQIVARLVSGEEFILTCASDSETELYFGWFESDASYLRAWTLIIYDDNSVDHFEVTTDKKINETLVAGSTPTITPVNKTKYTCVQKPLTSLTISNPSAVGGAYSIIFYSGSTPTAVTGIDNFTVEANKRYRIDVQDGYATFASWPYTPTP